MMGSGRITSGNWRNEMSGSGENLLVKVGTCREIPSAASSGSWDESGMGRVKQILLYYGDCINSIQTVLDNELNYIMSERHGGTGRNFKMIQLLGNEDIISISGVYDNFFERVATLTFTTNRRTYGPYGRESDTMSFCYETEEGSFGGFHGSSNNQVLTSIGIYVQTMATELLSVSSPLTSKQGK